MNLQVGMYVRTKYGINKIAKTFYAVSGVNHSYIELENCYIDDENDLRQGISIENIIEASFNIIDLIEPEDYVNEYKVSFIGEEPILGKYVQCDYPVKEGTCNHYRFYKDDIHSVVTKEQFKRMEYKI